jgi:eukaryotic-like serine/threonine-protein kinase
MPAPGDLLVDRYRIIGPLGSGGMATVHRARDERLGRDVAVKILLPNLAGDQATARRFDREARAMAAVTHPGLVAVFDVDAGDPDAGREPFVVMELCPGGSLANRLGPGRPLPPGELVPILTAIADALGALHHAGLVHRDVKPSNILFAADRVKLGDFGIARARAATDETELTQPGTALGTLAYLAPERLAGDPGGPPADVYALASIAHLGLTGVLARPAGSLQELITAAASPAPAVSKRAPELGSGFDAVIADGLAQDPARRPDAVTFGTRLAGALGTWTRAGGAAPGRSATERAESAPDDATTAMAVPVAATAAIARSRLEPPPGSGRSTSPVAAARRGPAVGWLASAAVVAIAAAVLFVGLSGLSPGGNAYPSLAGAASASPRPSASASVTASVSPSPPPSATPPPSADPAIAAIADMAAAIDAARGGRDGLKGKEANELDSRLGAVRTALDRGDRDAALRAARDLQRKTGDVTKRMDSATADPLRTAAASLVTTLGG